MRYGRIRSGTCIYCREMKTFSREHVLQDGFGHFEQALTLVSGVCSDCNGFFGEGMDTLLTRETFEGLERYRTGIKKADEISDWGKQGLVDYRLTAPAPWGGLLMRLESQEGRVVCNPVLPQLGIHCAATLRWVWITEEELSDPNFTLPTPLPGSGSRLALGSTAADRDRMLSLVQSRRITFQPERPAKYPYRNQDEVLLQMVETFPVEAQRALAKVAFNYLAKTCGAEFALGRCFDKCREFIRWGAKPTSPIVRASNQPILFGDTSQLRQTQGHLLTIGWYPSVHQLTGKVSLFNSLNYSVSLTDAFEGVWKPIRYGHHFDIQTKRVNEMAYL